MKEDSSDPEEMELYEEVDGEEINEEEEEECNLEMTDVESIESDDSVSDDDEKRQDPVIVFDRSNKNQKNNEFKGRMKMWFIS